MSKIISASRHRPLQEGCNQDFLEFRTKLWNVVHVMPLLTLQQIIQGMSPHVNIPYIKPDTCRFTNISALSATGTNLFKRGVDYLSPPKFTLNFRSLKTKQDSLSRDIKQKHGESSISLKLNCEFEILASPLSPFVIYRSLL